MRAHAIPASHLPVNALRPRSRPDYRTACVTSRHHRRCSSVRSPAGVTRWHHGGRPAARPPHCASLLRCRCGRPAAAIHVPSAAAATAATNSAARSRSRRCFAAIPAPEPACHTALRADNQERPCGRPCRSVPPAGLVAAARHPDRYGLRRFACRSGVSSASAPARRVASSLRSCAHAAVSTSPVWQPPPTAERLPQRRARAWQPGRRGAVFARGYTPQPARPPSLPAAATSRPHNINVDYRAS